MVPMASPFLLVPQADDVRRAREHAGHRPIDMAVILDVHRGTVEAWEQGSRLCPPALYLRYLLLTDQHPWLQRHGLAWQGT